MDVDQLPDALGEVDPGALRADGDMAPAPQRLGDQEQIRHPAPDVFRILPGHLTRRGRQRRPGVGQQLPAGLVQTDHRIRRIIGPFVNRQHILHLPDESRIGRRGDAPLRAQVRLEDVFLSVRRTVS